MSIPLRLRVSWPSLLVLVLLGTSGAPVAAEEPKGPPEPPARRSVEEAVAAVVRAHEGTDAKALGALAAARRPTPWEVVQRLVADGHEDAARAFVGLTQGPHVEKLGAYLATLAAGESDPLVAVFDAFREGERRLAAGDGEAATARLEASRAAAEALGYTSHVALAVRKLGDVRFRAGDLDGAFALYEEAIRRSRAAGDEAHEGVALHNRGIVHEQLGRFPEAARDFEASLALEQRAGTVRGVIYELLGLANLATRQFDYRTAAARLAEARRYPYLRTEPLLHGFTLHHLGIASAARGDAPTAEAQYREALAAYARAGASAHMASCQAALAALLARLGRLPEQRELLEAQLAILEKGTDRQAVATALNGLAAAQMRVGDVETSHATRRRAQALLGTLLAEAREAGNVAAELTLLGQLSYVAEAFEDGDAAIAYARQAYELARRREDPGQQLDFGTALARWLARAGRHGEAEPIVAASVKLAEELESRTHHADALILHGDTLFNLKRLPEARARFAAAAAIAEGMGAETRRLRARTWLARVAWQERDYGETVEHGQVAVAAANTIASRHAEGEASALRESFRDAFELGIRAAGELEDPVSLAWFTERSLAASLHQAFVSRDALRDAVLPEALRDELNSARAREAAALRGYRQAERRRRRDDIRRARDVFRAARRDREALVARVHREARRAAGLVQPMPDDLATLQSHLEPGDALLTYMETWDTVITVLVVRKDGARAVTISSEKPIGARLDEFYTRGDEGVFDDALHDMHAHLVNTLSLKDDVTRVLVAPGGRLNYIPFQLIFPNRAVVMVPSGTVYGAMRDRARQAGKGVLALGDPDYRSVVHAPRVLAMRGAAHTRGKARSGALALLPPLPASRAEAEAVGDVTLLGADANEAALRTALGSRPRWRALHLACHGLFDAERPMRSSLALTATPDDDGFLTCLDIVGLEVPADLVVLSACETGRGTIHKTEGVMGVTRAFMYAGAPTVICSLWKVDDEATRALMVKFYELWNPKKGKGISASAALRKAQAHVRAQAKWKHPYYWGAWCLWGLPD